MFKKTFSSLLQANRARCSHPRKCVRYLRTNVSLCGAESEQVNENVNNSNAAFGKFENGRTTYSEEEVNKFRLLADSWWDKEGDFKPLHSLNKLRVALVRNGLVQSGVAKPEFANGPRPLTGLSILDVGCGGGILCEPLARLGAHVTGLDAAQESVTVGKLHAQKDRRIRDNIEYTCSTIEEHIYSVKSEYDAVIASEVLEHVTAADFFINSCVSLIKPGGSLFITTLNKTLMSKIAAICIAEYLLRLLPRGTHNWDSFIPQQDLCFMLERSNCSIRLIHGMFYVPVKNEWIWTADSSVNYALHAIKSSS